MTETMRILRFICIIIAINSIDSVSDVCESPVPGLQQLTRGVDITKLDLSPQDLTQSNGFQRSIIPLTCTKGNDYLINMDQLDTFANIQSFCVKSFLIRYTYVMYIYMCVYMYSKF